MLHATPCASDQRAFRRHCAIYYKITYLLLKQPSDRPVTDFTLWRMYSISWSIDRYSVNRDGCVVYAGSATDSWESCWLLWTVVRPMAGPSWLSTLLILIAFRLVKSASSSPNHNRMFAGKCRLPMTSVRHHHHRHLSLFCFKFCLIRKSKHCRNHGYRVRIFVGVSTTVADKHTVKTLCDNNW